MHNAIMVEWYIFPYTAIDHTSVSILLYSRPSIVSDLSACYDLQNQFYTVYRKKPTQPICRFLYNKLVDFINQILQTDCADLFY